MHCQKVLVKPDCGKQRRNVNNWHHPIFGWTSERIDEGYLLLFIFFINKFFLGHRAHLLD